MDEGDVLFSDKLNNLSIHCSTKESMKNMCQKYADEIGKDLNTLLFLYEGKRLDLDSKFEDHVNSSDETCNIMKIKVYKIINDELKYPNGVRKFSIKSEKISKIISSYEIILDNINKIKDLLDKILMNTSNNIMNDQLNNINIIFNSIYEDIKKNNDEIKNLFKYNINYDMISTNLINIISQKKIEKKDCSNLEYFPNGIAKDIIKNENEIKLVIDKIDNIFPGSSFKLLYKGLRDGDNSSEFHSKCDDAPQTLVIIKDDLGHRFGGFTTQDWSGKYLQKTDNSAFIFSIDKNQTYDVFPNQKAIGCYPNFGPVFFGCQIRIYDNYFQKGGSTFKKGLNYQTNEDFELTDGNQNFGVEDIEVYEVED